MLIWMMVILTTVGLSLSSPQEERATTQSVITQRAVFDRMERAQARVFPSGQLPWIGNEQGRLGWTEAYVIRAFTRAAQLTSDPIWSSRLRDHVTQVLNRTDRARQIRDYRGVISSGWSAVDRSAHGERIVWLVDTSHLGMALLAAADVIEHHDHREQVWAESVREAVASALHDFDDQWRDYGNGLGGYVYRTDEPHAKGKGRLVPSERGLTLTEVPLPWNQQLLAAHAMRLLVKTRPEWRPKMAAIIKAWQQEVVTSDDGGWEWTYWGAPVSSVYSNSEPVHYAGIGLGLIGDLIEDGDPIATPAMHHAAVATANRILLPSMMATDVKALRWIPIPVPAGTNQGMTVQLAEWGRWYGEDCGRWRAAMQTLWDAGESPSSWMGWMELLSSGWCAASEPAVTPAPDPFAARL